MVAEKPWTIFARDVRTLAQRHWVRLLVGLHAVKMAFWFHSIEVGGGMPIVNVDYVQFFGRTLRIHEFLSRSGRVWGYDPFDMAGYLSGPFLEVGSHFMALVTYAVSPVLPVAGTLLILEVVGLALTPFLLVPGARWLGATRDQSWIAFGIGAFLIGSMEPFSTGMYKVGLWGWMVSSYGAIAAMGLFWKWMQAPDWRGWAAFTAAMALVFQIHPSSFINMAPAVAAGYVIRFRTLRPRAHFGVYAAAVVVLVANWFWISPFIAFPSWRVVAPYYDTAGLLDVFWRFGPLQPDVYSSVRAIIHFVIAVMAIRGLMGLRTTNRPAAALLAIWLGWLFVVAYFGSSLPWIWTLQPGRNEFPLWLVAYVAAGIGFSSLVMGPLLRRTIVLLAGLSLLNAFELWPGPAHWSKFTSPLRSSLPNWQRDLLQFLTREKGKEYRVMLECADDLQPHFADIVPFYSGVSLIGGQHPGNFLAARTTLFSGIYVTFQESRSEEPMAFGHSLASLDEERFAAYLDLYNVGLVIARTRQSIDALSRYENTLDVVKSLPPHVIYRVVQPAGWMAEGSGRVRFDYDRITIAGASPGTIIVKTHWLSTFKSSPAVPISPVYMMDDPVPFLRIDNAAGHEHIDIYNAGLPSIVSRLRNGFKDDWGNRKDEKK